MILHHGRATGFAFVALVATTLLAVYTANAYPTPRALQDVAAGPSDNAVAQPESTVLLEVVAAREPSMDLNLLSHDTIKARNPCMNCECEEDCPAMCCPQKTAAAAERSISDDIVADTLALTMATPPLELRAQNCIECGEGEDKLQAGPPNCCPPNHTHGHALILDNHPATTLLAEASNQNFDLTLMARDLDVNDVEQHHKRQTLDELALLPNKELRDNGDPCESCTCPHCPSMCCGSTTVVAEERALDGDADFAAPRLLDDTPQRVRLATSKELASHDEGPAETLQSEDYCDLCECELDCPNECCVGQMPLTARIAGEATTRKGLEGDVLLSTELTIRSQKATEDIKARGYCDECDCAVDCPQECCEDQTTITARIAGGEALGRSKEALDPATLSNELAIRGQAAGDLKARGECDGCDCNYNCPLTCCTDQADLTARIAGAAGEVFKDDDAGKALLWTELATREHEAKDIDTRDNCDGCSCDGDCPASCCEGETTATARIAGKVVIDTVENLERHLVSIELANRGEQATEEIKARQNCEGCLGLDSSLACPGWCPPACCPGQDTTERRVAGEVAEHAAERELDGHALLATELAIPGDDQEKMAEISARACVHCSCAAGDCPEECCIKAQSTIASRFAGEVVGRAAGKDLQGRALLSTELAIPGDDQEKTAEISARACIHCSCDAGDCPEYCCEPQTTATARFAGKMVADPEEDPEGDAILSIELAIPGDQKKTAELKARDICLGCTCDADCPEICCEGQTKIAARIDGVAAHSVRGAVAGVEDGHHLTRSELAVPRDQDKGAELHASDLWKRYCENCDCDVDCPLECCGNEKLVTERLAGEIVTNGAKGDLEGRHSLPSTELAVRGEEIMEARINPCSLCYCHSDCPAECCPEETQTTVTERISGETEAYPGERGDYDVDDGLSVSTAFAVRGEETVDMRACGGCSCGHTNCPTWCCGEEATTTAGIADVARSVEGGVQGLEERHHLLGSTELTARGQEMVKPDSCGGCDCDEGDCPVVCCGEAAIVPARIAEPAVEGAEDHHPRASAELTVRDQETVKPDNCPSCVYGEADCPTECCGKQEIVAERIAAESADLEGRAFSESTGVAVRGEKKAVEIKGGAALDDCAGCVCGETGCPTECCGKQETIVIERLVGEVAVAHEAAAEEVLEHRHHHHVLASTSSELIAREDETVQMRDCTNCICDEQECPAVCCPAKVSTTDGDVDVVKVLSGVEGRAEQKEG